MTTTEIPMPPTPQINLKPDIVGMGKCSVHGHHIFDRQFADMPCGNCRRDFCHTHAAKEPESEILPPLCAECGATYRANGAEGLRLVRKRLFRTYGS
ncbi:MAG: hypothetical protein Q8P88_03200 [Candidatus Jorgensenbacteria bacterium]|nr:hypothetical protein [Candidatus Jorgensenbacteria bacterium]